MLKYALVSALLLLGHPAIADETKPLKKTDVKEVVFYKNNTIEFNLKDDKIYRGEILTPDCLMGRKFFQSRTYIHGSYMLVHNEGFKTCRFSQLERIA